jgi:hypothetical protein
MAIVRAQLQKGKYMPHESTENIYYHLKSQLMSAKSTLQPLDPHWDKITQKDQTRTAKF